MDSQAARSRSVSQLQADYIFQLADEIARPRGDNHRPASWQLAIKGRNPEEVALVVLWCAMRHRPEDREHLPSVATVAQDIARGLGAHDTLPAQLGRPVERETLIQAGVNLLEMAVTVRMIRPFGQQGRDAGRVQLSDEALDRLDEYVQRCIAAGIAREMMPLADPPTIPARIIRNWRGMIEPPPLPPSYLLALDRIRQTRWRINEYVYRQMFTNLTPAQLRQVFRDLQEPGWRSYVKHKDRLAALVTATQWRDRDFYLDAWCDWRGRVYQGGALRFTGSDNSMRPLVEFADGELVNDEGAKHLAAYVAARWGQKGNQQELEAWTLANEKTLLAVALEPNKHKEWAKRDEDDKWHALACADAWRRYREGLPVHLPCSWDAVTSGLQVFALLMRDVGLAKLTGLVEDSEGTYYEEVGRRCGEIRKAAKAVAMPLFYGAKPRSSAEALALLDGRDESEWGEYRKRADALRKSAEDLAPAFVAVREWLTEVARRFNASAQEIRWQTPGGFTVIQDNHEVKARRIWTRIEGRKISVTVREPKGGIDSRKQAASIAANLVHSFDANWLIATVNRGWEAGIRSWGTVHDCFAVHCNDVGKLKQANYFAKIDVFGLDPLAQLHRQFEWQLQKKIPPPPAHTPRLHSDLIGGDRGLEPG